MDYNMLSRDQWWIVNKPLARKIGFDAAIILADLIAKFTYYTNTEGTILSDGLQYFYYTSEKIEEETTLTYSKQKKAMAILIELGLIKTKRIGTPAKLYFTLFENKISIFLNTCIEENSNLYIKNKDNKETTIIKEINKENKTSTDSDESSDIVRDELSESDDANVNIPTEYLNGRGETDLFNALSDSDIENSEIDKKLVVKHKEPSARWFKQIGSSKDYDILDEEDFQKFVEFRAEARKAGMRDDRSKTTAYVDFRRKYPKTDIAEVLNGFRQRKAERERDLANKEFVPMWKNMSTWINKKCWETDDMDIPENAELSTLSPEAQRYMSKSSAEKYLLKLEEIDRIFRETGKRIDISDAEDYILGRKIW